MKRRKKSRSARRQHQIQQTKKQQSNNKKNTANKQSTTTTKKPRRIRTGIKDPVEQLQKTQKTEVPRAFLARTASSYAYIAQCAVIDERTGEVYVDPKSLFSELGGATKQGGDRMLPRIFRNSHFQYFSPSSFPDHEPPLDGAPEVAFLGRSNTGKSSLINALSSLIGRRGELARTSKRPGRTQTINYYGLVPNEAELTSPGDDKSNHQIDANQSKLYLVDLPGFGYAAAPDEDVDAWQKRTQEFLISRASGIQEEEEETAQEVGDKGTQPWTEYEDSTKTNQLRSFGQHGTSPPLKRLYLLLDSRLPEPTLLDLTVMGWCDDYSIPYTIVLTKVDGTSRANCVKLTNQMCMRYHSLYMDTSQNESDDEDNSGEVCMDPVVYWTSAKDGLGMEELLFSVENNLFSADDEYDNDEELDEDEHGHHEEEVYRQ